MCDYPGYFLAERLSTKHTNLLLSLIVEDICYEGKGQIPQGWGGGGVTVKV